MKTIAIAAAIVTSLFAVAPATAAPKAAPSPNASEQSAAPIRTPHGPSTRYCYMTERTGSRIVSRVCKTRADWKDIGFTVPANL